MKQIGFHGPERLRQDQAARPFRALVASAGLSSASLFLIAAAITLFTGRPVLCSGTRQVLFGLAAAAVTFSVGRLIGVTIAGKMLLRGK